MILFCALGPNAPRTIIFRLSFSENFYRLKAVWYALSTTITNSIIHGLNFLINLLLTNLFNFGLTNPGLSLIAVGAFRPKSVFFCLETDRYFEFLSQPKWLFFMFLIEWFLYL